MRDSIQKQGSEIRAEAVLRKRNQLTLPSEAAELLGLHEGEVVVIEVKRHMATLRPVRRSYAGAPAGFTEMLSSTSNASALRGGRRHSAGAENLTRCYGSTGHERADRVLGRRPTITSLATLLIDQWIRDGRNRAVIGMVSAMELLVGPMRAGRGYDDVVDFLVRFPNVQTVPLDFSLGPLSHSASMRLSHYVT